MNAKINDLLASEIDDLVTIAERLSRDAARSGNELGPDRVTELSSVASRSGHPVTNCDRFTESPPTGFGAENLKT
jgi:hypothetical protein